MNGLIICCLTDKVIKLTYSLKFSGQHMYFADYLHLTDSATTKGYCGAGS